MCHAQEFELDPGEDEEPQKVPETMRSCGKIIDKKNWK